MYEVKTDGLEASFDALQDREAVTALKAEMEALKARIDAQAIVAGRPALDGAKAAGAGSAGGAFTELYLRKGIETGLELKSMNGASDAAGGYAVPREIDAAIDRALVAISPIRQIATVVRTGSAG